MPYKPNGDPGRSAITLKNQRVRKSHQHSNPYKNPQALRESVPPKRTQLTPLQVKSLWRAQEGVCGCSYGPGEKSCGVSLTIGFEDDHIIPIADGGLNDLSNRQLLAPACHRRKTFGTKATTYGSDIHAIAKTRRLEKIRTQGRKQKRTAIPSRPFSQYLRKKLNGKVERRA